MDGEEEGEENVFLTQSCCPFGLPHIYFLELLSLAGNKSTAKRGNQGTDAENQVFLFNEIEWIRIEKQNERKM